ncbi:TIGR02594 family protein [Rhizobium laguerreae]|uniref:TIGR02594 family protein n=1 Tax=Rhizobium laguerreae TaxID=1076926 RepID=UPI001C91FFD9|nr:TIGR02594 family protein [Rhizobium laguerreae]MBY3038938.1 TIGR02594 family protein [Rhizobium laguerreae]
MPRVPTYEESEQRVSLRPEYTQGFTVRADADAFGASVGRGMESLARGVSEVGEAALQAQELDDINRAKDADNKYAEWARNAMYGDSGFMSLEGKNAVEARSAFEQQANEKRTEYGKDLTPGAAKHYQDASQGRLNGLLNSSIQHSAGQRKAWFSDTSNARMSTFADDALADYGDTSKVNAALTGGINELKQQAFMHGWDNETFAAKKQEYVSGVTKNIVLRMAADDPLAADKYISDAGGRLTAADRYDLTKALKTPILAAKANRNVADITGGLSTPTYDEDGDMTFEPEASAPQGPLKDGKLREENGQVEYGGEGTTGRPQRNVNDVAQGVAGSRPFQQLAGQLMHMREGRDSGALSSFIKRATGLNVDPSVTPWCAAFANSILGAMGIKGTGSLSARSFLNFGMATDNPQPGDIVVLDRGGAGKGHVGFFQGYDANGRILVLGGNQGRNGEVSVSAQDPDKLLGFRTAGTVDPNTMQLPNYSPQGLQDINAKLDGITDPQEKAATAKALNAWFTSRKKAIDAAREQAQQFANTQVMKDPTFDPMKLPIDIQTAVGPAGMSSLMEYQEKVRTHGEPVTDDRTLYDLRTQYATDPQAFAQGDLFQFRSKLSNKDWDTVNGWRQAALTDQRKAKEDGLDLTGAFSQSRDQLEAVGVMKQPSKMSEADNKRVAQFQNALADQMEEFKQTNNGKKPTQTDVQAMINRLLLPIVIKAPGTLWGTNSQDGLMFEAGGRADNTTVETNIQYEDIPIDIRVKLAGYLETKLGRKPTNVEVSRQYGDFILSRK